jgi:hypothetical protein
LSYESDNFSLIILVTIVLLGGSAIAAYADCVDTGCPQGQRCEVDGRTGVGACIVKLRRVVGSAVTPNFMPNDGPGVSSHAPPQGPDCYANSDCRIGYTCEKGLDDPNIPGASNLPGNCLRTPPACRVDAECLKDEICKRGVNNATGGECYPRPVAQK